MMACNNRVVGVSIKKGFFLLFSQTTKTDTEIIHNDTVIVIHHTVIHCMIHYTSNTVVYSLLKLSTANVKTLPGLHSNITLFLNYSLNMIPSVSLTIKYEAQQAERVWSAL